MKKQLFLFVCVSIIASILFSCATMKDGSVQSVRFTSDPPGAVVRTKDEVLGVTPCEANVKRASKTPVTFTKDNYKDETVVLKGRFNNRTLWNGLVLPFWGLAFIPIDYLTGAAYKYSNNAYAKLSPKSEYMASSTQTVPPQNGSISSQVINSDVDTDIPETKAKNNNTFVIIIANEDYKSESKVPFAIRDGEIFKEYCIKTLGIPETNIDFLKNATFNEHRRAVRMIQQFASAFGAKSRIIFYYAGHGIPDENSQSAYLLPVDGYGSDPSTGYKVDDLYNALGALNVEDVTVFMDACFSGTKRDGTMMASTRGVAIKTKESASCGKMVVFSAATGDETAYPYIEKGHGLFTYYLLKKLQESKGTATYKDLFNYIESNVKERSFTLNRKMQTPTINVAPAVADVWKEKKL